MKVFTAQLLDAMSILKDARLIHCDLKPENILLKTYVYSSLVKNQTPSSTKELLIPFPRCGT